MTQIDYTAMSDRELKQYFLEHRTDRAALEAYLARRRNRSVTGITTVDDPDFDAKIQASIRKQMSEYRQGQQPSTDLSTGSVEGSTGEE